MYIPVLGDVSAVLLVIVIPLTTLYIYGTSYVGVFKAVGIPGPTPWPIINHMPELRKHGLSKMLDEWRKKYGKTYGIYGLFPRYPTLVTFDTRLLEYVMVKDFNNFVDRAGRNITLSSVIKVCCICFLSVIIHVKFSFLTRQKHLQHQLEWIKQTLIIFSWILIHTASKHICLIENKTLLWILY